MLVVQMLEVQSQEMIIGMYTEMEMAAEDLEVVGEIVGVEIIRMVIEGITEEMVGIEDLSVETEIIAGVNMDLEEVADVGEALGRGVKEVVVAKIDRL